MEDSSSPPKKKSMSSNNNNNTVNPLYVFIRWFLIHNCRPFDNEALQTLMNAAQAGGVSVTFNFGTTGLVPAPVPLPSPVHF